MLYGGRFWNVLINLLVEIEVVISVGNVVVNVSSLKLWIIFRVCGF